MMQCSYECGRNPARLRDRRSVALAWTVMAVILVSFPLLVGCGGGGRIETYTVPKEGNPDRMLGAILAGDENSWFLKLTGPNEVVAEQEAEFRALVDGVRLDEFGRPEWFLPVGWEEEPGSGMRYANLRTDGPPQLTVAVTQLPTMGREVDPYVLDNVNRWRGEMGLDPVSLAELSEATQQVSTEAGTWWLVNLEGRYRPGMSRPGAGPPPMAGGPGDGPGRPVDPPAGDPTPTLRFETPDAWTEATNDQFSLHAFEMQEGDATARLTVTRLAGTGGPRLDNINRWRAQVGLSPVDEATMAESETTRTVGGQTAYVYELTGESADAAGMLGVILPQGGSTWFIKLRGDRDLVLQQQANFQAFLDSIQFEEPTGGADNGD